MKRKVAQLTSTMRIDEEKGNVRDPEIENALQDIENLRDSLARSEEKLFQMGVYFTLYHTDLDKIKTIAKQIETALGGSMMLTKRSYLRQEQGFNTVLPQAIDEMNVVRNLNTGPVSTAFPFSSSDLSDNDGVLYGLNRHNDSLILFDRFKMENANMVVLATSGAGKSYAVKLEILRSLMLGTDVIVVDPESEYKDLSDMMGGTYMRLSLTSQQRINPFDLPQPTDDSEYQPGALLRSSIVNLSGLLELMLGKFTPKEAAIIDQALIDTYAIKGITMDTINPSEIPPPTMEDFYNVLSTVEGGDDLALRLRRYVDGTFGGIFNKPTNVNMGSGMVVFSIRDLDEELRPIAMYIILNYIWNTVRSEMKRRQLVIDEAWSVIQHEDAAKFLHGLVKRARKYYLGVTTITQNVEDLINTEYGQSIVSNASIQLLLKQSTSAIDKLKDVFKLTEGETMTLLSSDVGQGIFFAGQKHVAIQVISSYGEHQMITTKPEEVLEKKEQREQTQRKQFEEGEQN